MSVETSTWTTKKGLAQMLKGGVIMDVVTPDQARIAEDAGAVAVMALERVPADIRATGGVARMSDPTMIVGIMDAVTIPVMAKARIGHFVEAQVLEALGVDYIDESEVLTPGRREQPHRQARLQGAVRVRLPRPRRGAAAHQRGRGHDPHQGRGRHRQHRRGRAPHPLAVGRHPPLEAMRDDELFVAAKELQAPLRAGAATCLRTAGCRSSTSWPAASPRLPMRPWRCSSAPRASSSARASSRPRIRRARPHAIVQATTHFDDPKIIAEVSSGLGAPMRGLELAAIPEAERLAVRGW